MVCSRPQVSLVLSALQAGNKGTQACITAATAVSGIIADLDTTIMFASAGTLNAENEESFADHRLVLQTHPVVQDISTRPNRSLKSTLLLSFIPDWQSDILAAERGGNLCW